MNQTASCSIDNCYSSGESKRVSENSATTGKRKISIFVSRRQTARFQSVDQRGTSCDRKETAAR